MLYLITEERIISFNDEREVRQYNEDWEKACSEDCEILGKEKPDFDHIYFGMDFELFYDPQNGEVWQYNPFFRKLYGTSFADDGPLRIVKKAAVEDVNWFMVHLDKIFK